MGQRMRQAGTWWKIIGGMLVLFLLLLVQGIPAAYGLSAQGILQASAVPSLAAQKHKEPLTFPVRLHKSRWLPDIREREDYRGSPDRRCIYIRQNEQMMYIFEDGVVIRKIPCTTGLDKPGSRTPAWTGRVGKYWGTFQAYGVWADNAWFLFKDEGSILIHGAPYTYMQDAKVYQDLDALGNRPSSHGCIRISPQDALWLTEWGPQGVLTLISPLTVSASHE